MCTLIICIIRIKNYNKFINFIIYIYLQLILIFLTIETLGFREEYFGYAENLELMIL